MARFCQAFWGLLKSDARKNILVVAEVKSQNVAKPHSSGEETLWHDGRTCPDSGLHCGIGSHCLTDSCRKNEEEEEEDIRNENTQMVGDRGEAETLLNTQYSILEIKGDKKSQK